MMRMKQIFFLPYGVTGPYNILCGDTDHDSMNELIFSTYSGRSIWEIWEHSPFNFNHYNYVFADTGPTYPYPPGIHPGNFGTEDIGDIDRDGLTDLVGPNYEISNDSTYYIITTQESPNYNSYPENLSWSYRLSSLGYGYTYYFTNDLDRDGRNEILTFEDCDSFPYFRIVIIENIGNNQNIPVWHQGSNGSGFAFSDFDQDSLREFVTANPGSSGQVYVFENTGNDQYEKTFTDTVNIPNGTDVFSGNDVDSDGHPEFFIRFARVGWTFYLYMWETTGNNTYQRTLIDQVSRLRFDPGDMRSKCGDIDGDGIDEIVWSIASDVFVYKATGNNQFQVIWHWTYPGPGPSGFIQSVVNIYDMNRNGYNEIVISGNDTTRIYEVEAVRVLSPNGGETFHSDSQQMIRWQTFNPPRCDSLSIFYSIDYGRTYNLITHGLSGNDTSYLWTVPNVNSDSCKVKIIAFGPGWQYDESDGIFGITSTGIEENSTPNVLHLSLRVTPNIVKSSSTIRYSLPNEGKISLKLHDISGRLVKTLVNEQKKTGNYSITLNTKTLSAGVYFLSLQTNSKRLIERLVVVK